MHDVIDWLIANKNWIFSGAGIAVIGLIIKFIRKCLANRDSNKGSSVIIANHKSVIVQGNVKGNIKSGDTH